MDYGLLIAMEGIDKAGKSSQIDELAKRFTLSGEDVVVIHFPAYDTPTGQAIRAILDGVHPLTVQDNPYEVQALYMVNRYEQQMRIEHALMMGKVVICDRYIYSGVVYGITGGIQEDWLFQGQHSLIKPDVSILIDISEEEYLKRSKDYELDSFEADLQFIRSCSNLYNQYATAEGWLRVNGVGEVNDIANKIFERVQQKLKERED
jgi:dTMP kinase